MFKINFITQYFLFFIFLGGAFFLFSDTFTTFKTRSPSNAARSPQFDLSFLQGAEIQICSQLICVKAQGDKLKFANSGRLLSGTNIVVETISLHSKQQHESSLCNGFYLDLQKFFLICDNRLSQNKNHLRSFTMGSAMKIEEF